MGQVNTELGRSATATISLGETAVRTLAGVPSGTISMDNLRGKSNVVFSPDGGTSAGSPVLLDDYNYLNASVTINCSVSAVWTWTRVGLGNASVASGGSATGITFSISTTEFGGTKSGTFTVSATSGGITRYWSVYIQADDGS